MKDFVSRFRHGLIAAYCPSLPGGGSGNLLPDQSNSRNNITLTSFSQLDWASSQQGRTLYFDGVDNYGATQRQIFSGRSIVSVMTWAQTVSGTQIEIGEGDSNTFRAGFGLSGDGNSYIVNGQGGGAISNFCFASWSAFQGQAVCIVSVLDVTQGLNTDRAKIYIQGISRSLSYSGTGPLTSSPIGTFTGPTQIGRRPTNDNYSTGNLYCIAVWDRVITAEEAMQLYVLGPRGSSEAVSLKGNLRSTFAKRYAYKPAKPRNYSVIRNRDPNYSTLRHGLVAAYCPSISGQGNVLPDLVGGNHGTLANMSADDWVSSGDGRALDFDGVNDWIEIKSIRASFGFSFSCWLKASSATATRQSFFANSTSGFNPLYLHVERVSGTTAAMNFYSFAYLGLSASFTQDTDWHLYTWITDNSGLVSYYRDGKSLGSAASTWTPASYADTVATIGSLREVSGAGFIIGGQIDDCRIYNRPLSESEIKLLASKRGIGLEPRKPKITFADLGVQKTYSVVRVKETDYATLRQSLVGAWCPSLPNGGSGNTLPDVSGYGNHGSLVNMSPDDWVSGQYGRALDFDGVNDYVNTGTQLASLNGIASFTMMFWGKRRAANSALTVGKRSADADYILIAPWTDGNVYFEMSGYFPAASSNLTSWAHYAMTLRNGTIKGYINGVEVTSGTGPATVPTVASNYLLGLEPVANRYSDGQIDDFRVYSRALSEPEIRLLASRPGIGLRQESHRQTFYQFPSFQPAIARRSSAIIGGGIT